MMNPDVAFKLNTGPSYSIWTIEGFFDQLELARILTIIQLYPYKLTEADRTESDGPRVWCHEEELLAEVAKFFASDATKEYLSHVVGMNITGLRTRIELCMDRAGTWLQPHVDDRAKKLVMQIYLTDGANATSFGGKGNASKLNNGWLFLNTGTELHELSKLENNRASILVNYVDDTWRDRSVLVEQ